MEISFEQYALHTASDKRTVGLIQCYQQVFAAPPWNEDWWTEALVREVLNTYAGPHARIILAVSVGRVIGFAWGSVGTAKALGDELGLVLPSHISERVGYIKDIGVHANFRQLGVAKTLLSKLVSLLRESCSSDDWLLARTLAEPVPSVVFTWFPHVGFKEVVYYPSDSGRSGQVILGNTFKAVSL